MLIRADKGGSLDPLVAEKEKVQELEKQTEEQWEVGLLMDMQKCTGYLTLQFLPQLLAAIK